MTKRKPKPTFRLPKLRRSAGFDTRNVWAPPCWTEEHEPIFHYYPNHLNKRDDEYVEVKYWSERKLVNGKGSLVAMIGYKLKTPCGVVIKDAYDVDIQGVEFPMGHALQIGRLCKKCFPGGIEAERSWPTKDEIAKTTERLLELQSSLKKGDERTDNADR